MEFLQATEIGKVLRASTEGFTCGTRSQEINYPTFGAFVYTHHTNGNGDDLLVMGLITGIRIDDDPLVRQIIMASNMNPSMLRDQRENRLIPVEIDVLCIGYIQSNRPLYSLPPRPPLSLDPVCLCDRECISFFTEGLDFLRLILAAKNVSVPDLLGSSIREAAAAREQALQRNFLVSAGRRLAGLMSHDLNMLQQVLKMIRPS